MNLSYEKKQFYINKNINKNSKILFESYSDGYLSGLTENYIKVHVKGNKNLLKKIRKIKIISNTDIVSGVIVE